MRERIENLFREKLGIKLKNGIEISNFRIEENKIAVTFSFEFKSKAPTTEELMELFDPSYKGNPIILNHLIKKGWVDKNAAILVHFSLSDSKINLEAKKGYIKFEPADPWNPPVQPK